MYDSRENSLVISPYLFPLPIIIDTWLISLHLLPPPSTGYFSSKSQTSFHPYSLQYVFLKLFSFLKRNPNSIIPTEYLKQILNIINVHIFVIFKKFTILWLLES